SDVGRGILLIYGPEASRPGERVTYSFIPVHNLYEVKGGGRFGARGGERKTLLMKGEAVVMTELRFLMEDKKKPKVYFLQGHQELDTQDVPTEELDLFRGRNPNEFGGGRLVERLKKDNYKVHGLSFGPPPPRHVPGPDDLMVYARADKKGAKDVPDDASLVVIADPG